MDAVSVTVWQHCLEVAKTHCQVCSAVAPTDSAHETRELTKCLAVLGIALNMTTHLKDAVSSNLLNTDTDIC